MIDGQSVVEALRTCGITHVVWLPDSHVGRWEPALHSAGVPQLIRATREGEAIAIAGGLLLGGAKPLVVIQCTGLFEAGDALRNIAHDLQLPLLLLIGVRSARAYRDGKTSDNCPAFTEPVLTAWRIPFTWIDPESQTITDFISTLRRTTLSGKPGAVLWME